MYLFDYSGILMVAVSFILRHAESLASRKFGILFFYVIGLVFTRTWHLPSTEGPSMPDRENLISLFAGSTIHLILVDDARTAKQRLSFVLR